jgi:hypothetical protein
MHQCFKAAIQKMNATRGFMFINDDLLVQPHFALNLNLDKIWFQSNDNETLLFHYYRMDQDLEEQKKKKKHYLWLWGDRYFGFPGLCRFWGNLPEEHKKAYLAKAKVPLAPMHIWSDFLYLPMWATKPFVELAELEDAKNLFLELFIPFAVITLWEPEKQNIEILGKNQFYFRQNKERYDLVVWVSEQPDRFWYHPVKLGSEENRKEMRRFLEERNRQGLW